MSTRLTEITRLEQQTTFNGQAVLNGAGSVSFQIGAFNGQEITADFGSQKWDASSLGISGLTVATASDAQAAMNSIDTVLTSVNTFQAAIPTTQTEATNMSAAESQITDADFATDTATLSSAQVLQQAGISVLAQANSLPQQVLKLLQ